VYYSLTQGLPFAINIVTLIIFDCIRFGETVRAEGRLTVAFAADAADATGAVAAGAPMSCSAGGYERLKHDVTAVRHTIKTPQQTTTDSDGNLLS